MLKSAACVPSTMSDFVPGGVEERAVPRSTVVRLVVVDDAATIIPAKDFDGVAADSGTMSEVVKAIIVCRRTRRRPDTT